MNTPIYGLGYEPIGDLVDWLPPVALAKYVGRKVDSYVDEKAAKAGTRAGTAAAQHVETTVKKAVTNTAHTVGWVLAGGALFGAVAGGIYLYRRSREDDR